jgi:hypothetical protein
VAWQVAELGLIFILCRWWLSAIALLAGKISERLLKSDRAQIMLNRFAGTVFLALAAKLAPPIADQAASPPSSAARLCAASQLPRPATLPLRSGRSPMARQRCHAARAPAASGPARGRDRPARHPGTDCPA